MIDAQVATAVTRSAPDTTPATMSNPLSLLPYALAAANGRVDGHSAAALIAAGLTLLQRSAPLVRALSNQTPALLLPQGPAFVAALGACDGHTALVLDPAADASATGAALRLAGAGVVFTHSALATQVPDGPLIVRLDNVPREAEVSGPGVTARCIDLGSHVGLTLEGERDPEGSEAPVLQWVDDYGLRRLSHREIFAAATISPDTAQSGAYRGDVTRVIETLLLPLLRGAHC